MQPSAVAIVCLVVYGVIATAFLVQKMIQNGILKSDYDAMDVSLRSSMDRLERVAAQRDEQKRIVDRMVNEPETVKLKKDLARITKEAQEADVRRAEAENSEAQYRAGFVRLAELFDKEALNLRAFLPHRKAFTGTEDLVGIMKGKAKEQGLRIAAPDEADVNQSTGS